MSTLDGKQNTIVAVVSLFVVTSFFLVPLRCYARLKVVRRLALEDWFMVLALVLFTIEAGVLYKLVALGLGRHQAGLPEADIEQAYLHWLIGESLYAATQLFAKVSICLLLLRFMVSLWQRVFLCLILFLMIGAGLLGLFWVIYQCNPVDAFWHLSERDQCRANIFTIVAYVHGGVSIATDWALALIPFLVLRKTQLSLKVRIGTGLILSLGAFASITSIVRIVYIRELNTSGDLLYSASNCLIWSVTEEGATIAAGCIACYRPLFIKVKRVAENHEDDGTRGRSGRPRQPFDTQLEMDPGLTIGTIRGTRTNFSEDLPIQLPSEKHSSDDLHLTQRSDSSVPFHMDTLVKEKGLNIMVGNVKQEPRGEDETDRTSSDWESFDMTQLKRHYTTDSDSTDAASL
ncbi:hypothetical protein MBLNU457_4018t1 [Dothideomycetes sp. NU457]